jgi:predicted Zn-dependent peptidase
LLNLFQVNVLFGKKLIQKKPIILKSGESAHVNISTKINGQNYLDEMDIPSLQVSWVYPIQDSISSEDKITLSILMSLLGRGRTAILTKKLREERGLVYDVSADINFSSNFQYISINTSLSKENMQEAEKIIFEQIRNIKDGLINEELLSHAKNRYEKSLPMYFETVGDMAAFFTEKIVYYRDESLNIDKYLEIYMNITSKDLVRLARKYFKDENRSMFVVGNR